MGKKNRTYSIMDIKITDNSLRSLNRYFMILHPIKDGEVVAGGKYNLVHDEYGNLGQIECMRVVNSMLYDLTHVTVLLSEGKHKSEYLKQMSAKRLQQVDVIQCCVFHFLRRSDVSFQKLIEKEVPRAGVQFVIQPTMFS